MNKAVLRTLRRSASRASTAGSRLGDRVSMNRPPDSIGAQRASVSIQGSTEGMWTYRAFEGGSHHSLALPQVTGWEAGVIAARSVPVWQQDRG